MDRHPPGETPRDLPTRMTESEAPDPGPLPTIGRSDDTCPSRRGPHAATPVHESCTGNRVLRFAHRRGCGRSERAFGCCRGHRGSCTAVFVRELCTGDRVLLCTYRYECERLSTSGEVPLVIPARLSVIPVCSPLVVPACLSVIPVCSPLVIPACLSVTPVCRPVVPVCLSVTPACLLVIPACAFLVVPARFWPGSPAAGGFRPRTGRNGEDRLRGDSSAQAGLRGCDRARFVSDRLRRERPVRTRAHRWGRDVLSGSAFGVRVSAGSRCG